MNSSQIDSRFGGQGLQSASIATPQPERQPEVLNALDSLSSALTELGGALSSLNKRLDKVSRMPGPVSNTKAEAVAYTCQLETAIRDKASQVRRYIDAVIDMRDRLEV